MVKLDDKTIWDTNPKNLSYDDLMEVIRVLDAEREALRRSADVRTEEQNNQLFSTMTKETGIK